MAERRLWVKLWATWYTTPSHIGVGAMALHVGAMLMTLVLWEPGRDDAWAEFETGAPMPIDAIADRAQTTAKIAEQALLKLQERGTVSRRPDGAWGFELYGPSQESADAARKRKARKSAGQSEDCPPDVQRIAEADGEADVNFSLRSNTPTPRKTSKRKVEPNPDDIAVLDAVDEARVRQGLDPMSAEARTTGTIAKRRKLGATQAQLLEQVAVFERLAERDPSKRTLLCATTPFTAPGAGGGKGGWQWGRDMLDEERVLELRAKRVRSEAGGRVGRDVDDVIADREVAT
jgi:hypothetical protein